MVRWIPASLSDAGGDVIEVAVRDLDAEKPEWQNCTPCLAPGDSPPFNPGQIPVPADWNTTAPSLSRHHSVSLNGPAKPGPSFKVLGWDSERKSIYFQSRATGQISKEKPSTSTAFFLKLEPNLGYWRYTFSSLGKTKSAFDIVTAYSALINQADDAGIFRTAMARGLGVYRDAGRTIWHLGDRLEVDGTCFQISEVESEFTYAQRPQLPVNPQAQPSSNTEGKRLIDIIERMGWEGENDHLYVAGWAVASNVAAALSKRPGLQVTSAFSTGKTDTRENVIQPLQAGTGLHLSNPTGAGVRQNLSSDTLPVCIDESEAENQHRRNEHLMLVRQSYDGTPMFMGTGSGDGTCYPCRSSVALFSINAPMPKPADASRLVVIRRKRIPQAEWDKLVKERSHFVTSELGNRIMRRTVNHLDVLLDNIEVFMGAIRSKVGTSCPPRYDERHGILLACSHSLCSTEVIDLTQAEAWLDEHGWTFVEEEDADEGEAALSEAYQCLEHLLGFRPTGWRGHTLGELVQAVHGNDSPNEADEKRLGSYGLKVDRKQGLYVANSGTGIQSIYRSTCWRDGGHKNRLCELPRVSRCKQPDHFRGSGTLRYCVIPWSTKGLELETPIDEDS